MAGKLAGEKSSVAKDVAKESEADLRSKAVPVDLDPAELEPAASDADAAEIASPDADIAADTQQIDQDGVDEDMATLALNPVGFPSSETAEWNGVKAPRPDAEIAEAGAAVSEDAAIMLRLKAGELECFDTLMNKYRRPIVHFMYRMVHNQAIAEEMAQEVFLRVYRSRETYRAEARFSTWLYRIATNLAVNHARDTKNERTAPKVLLDEPDYETGSTPDVADSTPSAEASMLRRERMQAIKKHVMALPERQRNAVLMHKYQEMDYRQIGEVLHLSESATKSLLFRAYQTLRDRLKDFV